MGGIFDFIMSGWQKILAYVGIAAIVFGVGTYTGYEYRDGKEAKQEVAAVVKQAEVKEENQTVADKAGDKAEAKDKQVRIVYRTITKKVVEYVEKNPDAREPIGVDWVRLHNEAAAGELASDSTSEPAPNVPTPTADPKP